MKPQAIAIVLSSLLLAACALNQHDVAMELNAPVEASTLGTGVRVSLRVEDDRDDLVVGQRGYDSQGADITADDVIPTLEREIAGGLEAKGFTVVSQGEAADAELWADLRNFSFVLESSLFSGSQTINVVLRANVEKGGKELQRTYKLNEEEVRWIAPTASGLNEIMSDALSRVMAQMMSDRELMSFLAS